MPFGDQLYGVRQRNHMVHTGILIFGVYSLSNTRIEALGTALSMLKSELGTLAGHGGRHHAWRHLSTRRGRQLQMAMYTYPRHPCRPTARRVVTLVLMGCSEAGSLIGSHVQAGVNEGTCEVGTGDVERCVPSIGLRTRCHRTIHTFPPRPATKKQEHSCQLVCSPGGKECRECTAMQLLPQRYDVSASILAGTIKRCNHILGGGYAAHQALFPVSTVSVTISKLFDDRLLHCVSCGTPLDNIPQHGRDPP